MKIRDRRYAAAGVAGLTVLGGMVFAVMATNGGTRDDGGADVASTGPPPEVVEGSGSSNGSPKPGRSLPAAVASRLAEVREAAKKHSGADHPPRFRRAPQRSRAK